MQRINLGSDVFPFAGRVVAFETNAPYLDGTPLNNTKFGWIEKRSSHWSGGETGWNMSRLIKPDDVSSNCALVTSKLSDPFFMRLATKEEVEFILREIHAKRARFEYINKITTIFEKS